MSTDENRYNLSLLRSRRTREIRTNFH